MEQVLHEIVSDELHELAWYSGYPINHIVALECFFHGVKNHIPFVTEKRSATFLLTKEIDGKMYELSSEMSFNEILEGWNYSSKYPKGSVKNLYDSICEIFDRMGENVFDRDCWADRERRNEFLAFRNSESKIVRKNMEKFLLENFNTYQENLFIPVFGSVPELGEPRLFSKIYESFPVHILDKSFVNESTMGPCEDTLLEILQEGNEDCLDEDYFPSDSSIIHVFLGNYLYRFSQIKGYKTWHGNPLRECVASGARAFMYGSLFQWPDELRAREKNYAM